MPHNTMDLALAQKLNLLSLTWIACSITSTASPTAANQRGCVPFDGRSGLCHLAKLAGEDEPEGIAHWDWLRKQLLIEALKLKRHSTPHPTTFSRILGQAVNSQALQQAVTRFLLLTVPDGLSVELPIDAKTLRGTIPAGKTQGVHLLAAYLPQPGIVLMQVEVDGKEMRSALPQGC